MGGSEVFQYWWFTQLLGTAVIAILSIFSSKNLLARFSALKVARKDYYECGFRPHVQRPIQMSMQFVLICICFIIYDIELNFSFPLMASVSYGGLELFTNFFLIYVTMSMSLHFDFDRNLLSWKFS